MWAVSCLLPCFPATVLKPAHQETGKDPGLKPLCGKASAGGNTVESWNGAKREYGEPEEIASKAPHMQTVLRPLTCPRPCHTTASQLLVGVGQQAGPSGNTAQF